MVPSYVCPREPGRVSRDSERKAKWGNSKWYMEGMGFICCDSRNKDISGRILLQERRTTVDHIGCRLLPIYHPRAQVIHALCCDFITVHRIQIQGTHFCLSVGSILVKDSVGVSGSIWAAPAPQLGMLLRICTQRIPPQPFQNPPPNT